MALDIDDQTPAASPPAREALIRAVLNGSANESEPTWVEWKGQIDELRTWAPRIAFYILGFANRMPDVAARHMGGNAYLLLGVEPGVLHGVAQADTSDLHNWISPFLGSHGPQWDPHFVAIGDTVVLLVAVPPPRWGDPIFRVRRDSTHDPNFQMRDGEVIVRRLGQTARANSEEQDALDERARGGRRQIDISLRDDSGPLIAVDLGPDPMEAWLAAERKALLSSSPRKPKPVTEPEATSVREALGVSSAALNRMMENLRATSSPEMLAAVTGETRSRDQYVAEVERYLEEARNSWSKRVVTLVTQHRLAQLDLTIRNETDDNFTAVEAVVSVPGRVWAFFDAPTPRLPSRPVAFGAMRRFGTFSSMNLGPLLSPRLPDVNLPRGYIDNSGSAVITFPPVDLRPEEGWRLEPVLLVIGAEHADQQLEASWKITSTSARGKSDGRFSLIVSPQIADPHDLMTRAVDDDDLGDEDDF